MQLNSINTKNDFLERVSQLTTKVCGDVFAQRMVTLRAERERLLQHSWKATSPAILLEEEKKDIFRMIDFDTMVLGSSEYLSKEKYVDLLYKIAETATNFGEFDRAENLLQLVISKYSEVVSDDLSANTHRKLGEIAFFRNNWAVAHEEYRQSLALFVEMSDDEGIASLKSALGTVCMEQGAISNGESLLIEAKELAKSAGLDHLLVKIDHNLGNVYSMRGIWDEAMKCYVEVLSVIDNNGQHKIKARIHHDIAIIHRARRQYSKALEHLKISIDFADKADDVHTQGLSILEEAEVCCGKGDYASSTALATDAFKIFSLLGDRLSVAEVYKLFGVINRENKQFDTAFSYLTNSKKINEDYDNPLNLGETYFELARLYAINGDVEESDNCIVKAKDCFNRIKADGKIAEMNNIFSS